MAKHSPNRHKNPDMGLSVRPYMETCMRGFGLYPCRAFSVSELATAVVYQLANGPMLTLFSFICFGSLLCFVVGLIQPSLFKLASRKHVTYIFSGIFLLSFIAIAVLAPPQSPQKPVTVQEPVTSVVSVQTATTTQHVATRSECTLATKTTFSKMIDSYSTLYGEGKGALGTTPYPNAQIGLKDFEVAGTPAYNFSMWQKTYHAMNPTPFDQMMSVYRTASDCYSTVGTEEPASLTALRDDMGDLDSAISVWAVNAINWQDSVNSDAKLRSDESKVKALFITVKKDVANLK